MDMLAELVMLRNRRETELSDLQEVYHELIGSVSKMRMLSTETDDHTVNSSSLQLSEIANDVLEVAQNVRDARVQSPKATSQSHSSSVSFVRNWSNFAARLSQVCSDGCNESFATLPVPNRRMFNYNCWVKMLESNDRCSNAYTSRCYTSFEIVSVMVSKLPMSECDRGRIQRERSRWRPIQARTCS